MPEEPISAGLYPPKYSQVAEEVKLYVDDMRHPPDSTWCVIRHPDDAIAVMELLRGIGITVEALALDHDMGEDQSVLGQRPELTTRPIVDWMIENDYWPEHITVHSANPWAARYLEERIRDYRPGGPGHE